jgi:hypothetical protein
MRAATLTSLRLSLLAACVASGWLWLWTQSRRLDLLSWGRPPRFSFDVVSDAGSLAVYFNCPLGNALIPSWSGGGEISLPYWVLMLLVALWPLAALTGWVARDKGIKLQSVRRRVRVVATYILGIITIGLLATYRAPSSPPLPLGTGWHSIAGGVIYESRHLPPVFRSATMSTVGPFSGFDHYYFIAPGLLSAGRYIAVAHIQPASLRFDLFDVLEIDLWGPWFVFMSVIVATLIRNPLGRRRMQNGVCERCGYDLRATPERCPECGTVVVKKAAAKPAAQ